MANTLMKLLVSLGIDSSGLEKGLDKAEGTTKKSAANMQASLRKLSDGFSNAGDVLTVGLTLPLFAFGAASVKAAMDSESAMAELTAVIKSTGGAAGVTADQVTKYATAMQKVTKFDDEAIIKGQSMLLTFTKIGKDVFPTASTAMLNMAEKFGSVDQAAVQLGKALNDPVQGVGALRRVGVALSDQQEKQIKDFMKVNDIASAQKIILKELETEFGGLAEAAGNTTAGKFIQFKNALGDLQEVVGAALLPNLIALTNGLRRLIDGFMALPKGAQDAIIGFGIFLAALGPILKGISLVLTVVNAFGAGGALAGAGTALAGFGTAAGAALAGVAAAVGSVLLPIALVVAAIGLLYLAWKNNFGGIQETTKILVDQLSIWFGNMGETFNQIISIITIGFQNIVPAIEFVINVIQTAFMGTLNNLWKLLKAIANFVIGYFTAGWRNVVTVIMWVISAMQYLAQVWAQMKPPAWFGRGASTPSAGSAGTSSVTAPAGTQRVGSQSFGSNAGAGMTVNLVVGGAIAASQRQEIINSSREATLFAFGQALDMGGS